MIANISKFMPDNAGDLVAGQQVGRRLPPRILLEVDVGRRLPADIADYEAGVGSLDRPGPQERQDGTSKSEGSERAEIHRVFPCRWTVSRCQAYALFGRLSSQHPSAP